MIAGLDILVLFPEFDGPFRIAFQVDEGGNSFQSHQSVHLVHHLEDQGAFVKGKTFGNTRFAYAVFADFFDVHRFWIS
jgi:hypothetical protein